MLNFVKKIQIKFMKTYYREPLTKEEINLHKNNYENKTPAVYVGTYGKYNSSSIFGMWVDLTTFDSYEEFLEFGERLHADEADPELMFQDYECFPSEYYGESHLEFDEIIEWYNLDEDEREAFEAYIEIEGKYATIERFQEAYFGHFDTPEEFAEELYLNNGGMENVPEWLINHIDWSSVWRDLKCSGDYWKNKGYYFASI